MRTKKRRVAPRSAIQDMARHAVRYLLLAIGAFLTVLGFLMAPLPGPLGLPVTLVGLMLVLRNSYQARRAFIRFQRKHPRILFPLRRLLRRDPEVIPIAYQQALRIEHMVVPRDWRRLKHWRRKYFRHKGPRPPSSGSGHHAERAHRHGLVG
jgi:hypothetical protein